MDRLIDSAVSFEQLGIVAVLFLVIVAMSWMLRSLHKQERECQAARLEDAEDRADLREKLGALSSKVDMMDLMHRQTLLAIKGERT